MNPQKKLLLLATAMAMIAGAGHSRMVPAAQAAASIQGSIEHFLRAQTAGLPGTVSHSIGPIDARTCAAPEVFLPPGARLWGKSHVGVRCSVPASWTIYV
ncbi:MAG: flagellar basal body P-ring formation protein FlgA, partial [Burkholderiales bacterium]|nr:flagellar basal body P-ring formation protein FlgA [Burkholderiales bacterium]